jgi:hypothetical protein
MVERTSTVTMIYTDSISRNLKYADYLLERYKL